MKELIGLKIGIWVIKMKGKGWYGDRKRHGLASKGIRTVEPMKEGVFDYDNRLIGMASWKEFTIDNVGSMEEAIDLVIGYELSERENEIIKKRDDEISYYKNKFKEMSPEQKKYFLKSCNMNELEFLKDIMDDYTKEIKIMKFVLKNSSYDLLISDNSYEENGIYYIDFNSGFVENEIGKKMSNYRGA